LEFPDDGQTSKVLEWPGGDGWALCAYATGPGAMTLQVFETLTETWVDSDVSFDAESGIKHFKLPPELRVRLRVSGESSDTRITATVTIDTRKSSLAT
jgi:hypothetical protein